MGRETSRRSSPTESDRRGERPIGVTPQRVTRSPQPSRPRLSETWVGLCTRHVDVHALRSQLTGSNASVSGARPREYEQNKAGESVHHGALRWWLTGTVGGLLTRRSP